MITDTEAVRKSLIKYCYEGAFCIASGDGKEFTKFYLKENVPFLDVTDSNYWLVEKSLKPVESPVPSGTEAEPAPTHSQVFDAATAVETAQASAGTEVKEFKSITISGNVPLERYTELFNYFITPFAMNGNKIEIQVSFKIVSTESSPLNESKQQYKNAKEAAKQLRLSVEEEPES